MSILAFEACYPSVCLPVHKLLWHLLSSRSWQLWSPVWCVSYPLLGRYAQPGHLDPVIFDIDIDVCLAPVESILKAFKGFQETKGRVKS